MGIIAAFACLSFRLRVLPRHRGLPRPVRTAMAFAFPLKGLKAVLWDIDGTLAEATDMALSCTNEVLQRAGHAKVSQAEYLSACKYTTPRRLAAHATGDPDNPVGEELGEAFDKLYVGMVNSQTAPLYNGVLEVLQEQRSRGRVHGALSNACGAYVRAVLHSNDVTGLFETGATLGADEVPEAKPSAAGLKQLLEILRLEAADCVYVGDSPTDGAAAANAGMASIGVTYGASDRARLEGSFDLLVDSVDELRSAL